jgi:hypothetical protein
LILAEPPEVLDTAAKTVCGGGGPTVRVVEPETDPSVAATEA